MFQLRAASIAVPLLAALIFTPISPVSVFAERPKPVSIFPQRHKHVGVENKERKAILNGKTIRSISVTVRDIFDKGEKGVIYETANEVKFKTHEAVVKRELLFKEGDTYDQFRVEESIRNIRSLGYLTKIEVLPRIDGDNVDLEVRVQDTWTFIPQFGYSSGTGSSNLSAGLVESNLFGYGKRAELLYSENENRKGLQTVYADNHIFDTEARFVGGVFIRNDGNREVYDVGKPFRTLAQRDSWATSGDILDTIGRLFEDGTESYIYRQQKSDVDLRYAIATGDAEVRVRRFSLGYNYDEAQFTQATLQDYEDLDLDPATVSNDPAGLANNRRFSGPVLAYQMVEPDFISLDFIDRFERVQDYNLGDTFSFSTQVAPHVFGSLGNYVLLNTNRSLGQRFSNRSFLRAEVGANSRYGDGNFENTLARGEVKFFHSFLPSYYDGQFLGRHTLAANFFLDYGDKLDKDRQFLVGGDNVIRGYKANTLSGDKRFGLNVEDRVHFVEDLYELISLGGAVFADVGSATDQPMGDLFSNDVLADVGIGLRIAFPRSSGGKILRIDLAFPLKDGPDGSNSWQIRAVFQGGQLFSSQLRSEALGAERSNIEVGTDK